jgi:hypothetical protein
LTGRDDFTLRFGCEGCEFSGDSDGSDGVPNIFVALRKQLGLKVEGVPWT